jgi:serine/threonine-protein kinase
MTTPRPGQGETARLETAVKPSAPPRAHGVQFSPGTIIAGRYRISGILGSGGMGEVYRADDTKLDQPVALKFLPARLARDPILLGRLHDEVRHGRQIAHPNVCRIYDIVEWEDAHFVAMEYVDGEDLSRLLRRIGRLPSDKAIDIARGVAAGLLAAHAKGILHRDLKPANVMLDSRGDARITDFGLALSASDEQSGEIAGTPAYMAPEQLEGAPATVQSDLYALGLLMYELFTGKRAHAGKTFPDRLRESSSQITTPSEHIHDIDASVERIILRCLSRDPAERPQSAREVIAALPGGDPLAAALAAGETPSPRVVAAAGTEGSLSRRVAWSMLAAIAVLLVVQFALYRMTALSKYVSLDRSPEVLRQRGREILHQLGIPVRGTPITYFGLRREYFAWLLHSPKPNKWEALRNGPAPFVYVIKYGFTPDESWNIPVMGGAPGKTWTSVDWQGRLTYLIAAPESPVTPRPLDWRPLLGATGVDVPSLRATPPRLLPAVPFDARAAWSGTYSGDATPIRVEAAAWQGRPVFLRVTGAWDEVKNPLARMAFSGGPNLFWVVAPLVVVISALPLAWRNLRLRRGDRQGALRFAIVFFAIDFVAGALTAQYADGLDGFLGGIWDDALAPAAAGAVILYVLYIALEPFARKKWPEQLISWTRLLSGRIRDPMVGRDVMIGIAGGLLHMIVSHGGRILVSRLSGDSIVPLFYPGSHLLGFRYAMGSILTWLTSNIGRAMAMIMILVLLTIILRKRALAAGALFLVFLTIYMINVGGQHELIPVYVAVAALETFVVVRFGMIAFAAMNTTFFVIFFASAETSSWIAGLAVIHVAAIVALALWAFRVSLGGQTMWHPNLLDD